MGSSKFFLTKIWEHSRAERLSIVGDLTRKNLYIGYSYFIELSWNKASYFSSFVALETKIMRISRKSTIKTSIICPPSGLESQYTVRHHAWRDT
jgi:hypothetical protein